MFILEARGRFPGWRNMTGAQRRNARMEAMFERARRQTESAIATIDRQIDAVREELLSLENVDQLCAASWQQAWDKHPDLHRREKELFRHRGLAQAWPAY